MNEPVHSRPVHGAFRSHVTLRLSFAINIVLMLLQAVHSELNGISFACPEHAKVITLMSMSFVLC